MKRRQVIGAGILGLCGMIAVALIGCSDGQPKPFAKLGPDIPADAAFVSLAELDKNLSKFAETDVFVKGKVVNQCPSSGCWIDVKDDTGAFVRIHITNFPEAIGGLKGKLVGKDVKVEGYVRSSKEGQSVVMDACSLEAQEAHAEHGR